MAPIRFTTTRLSELQAAGRLQELQHAVIAPFLERELGPDYGRLFADFEVEASDVRGWYVEAAVPPRPIDDLDPAAQAALRQRVADMVAQILDLAGHLGAQGPQKANLARILIAATTFPAEDIWIVDAQPVIVNWGFHRQSEPLGPPRAIAALFVDRGQPQRGPPPVSTPPNHVSEPTEPATIVRPPEPRPRSLVGLASLLWLLFVALVGGSYALLLPACGIDGRWTILSSLPFLNACPAAGDADALARDGVRLQGLVEQEELRIAQASRQCAVRPPRQTGLTPVEGQQPHAASAQEEQDFRRILPPDAPRGSVEVTLTWKNKADLDLIIECPGGDRLWRNSPNLQACGGRLMRDINVAGQAPVDEPVEHAAWSSPPGGTFTIKVELYRYNGVPMNTEIPFTVRIQRGSDVEVIDGGRVKGEKSIVTSTTAAL